MFENDIRNHNDGVILKGVFHYHTELSYDSNISLEELSKKLQKEGYHFAALTEHTKDVTIDNYIEYINQCKKLSNDKFVLIPGLEIRCGDGIEIAGIGLNNYIPDKSPNEVINSINQQGGYAVWVHPEKYTEYKPGLFHPNAIEVLNGNVDGEIAPKFSLINKIKNYNNKSLHATHFIFGSDLHFIPSSHAIWIECRVACFTTESIISAFHNGTYISCVKFGKMGSNGLFNCKDMLKLIILRSVYIIWNFFLKKSPSPLRNKISHFIRPIIKRIKK